MHWTKNLYGLTSFRWNLKTFDGPLAHATFDHVDDVQISLVHVFLSAIASLTQKIDDWKELNFQDGRANCTWDEKREDSSNTELNLRMINS